MEHKPHISIISPVYHAENLIEQLVEEILVAIQNLKVAYEIILVEDGSSDRSWDKIKTLCKENSNVKGIKLSRNFGQHYAITAGLEASKGEWVVVMDCDLQDKPVEINNLYNKALEGFDLVLARRIVRQDSFFKRASSQLFYNIFGYLTDTKQDQTIGNFGIYNQKVIHAIISMKDYTRFFPTMVNWVGYNSAYIDVSHGKREEGVSSYSWRKLIKLAFDNIIAFSDKPLRITVTLGLGISFISFIIAIYYIVEYYTGNIVIIGYASLIVSVWFLSGLIIFILGIVGIYVGKTFESSKNRPTYIVHEQLNMKV